MSGGLSFPATLLLHNEIAPSSPTVSQPAGGVFLQEVEGNEWVCTDSILRRAAGQGMDRSSVQGPGSAKRSTGAEGGVRGGGG